MRHVRNKYILHSQNLEISWHKLGRLYPHLPLLKTKSRIFIVISLDSGFVISRSTQQEFEYESFAPFIYSWCMKL
jgi:hypothetical protein